MLLGLRGGGPVRFKTNEQAMRSDNFQNIAQLEAQNFEAALSVALKMMTPNGADQKRFDISDFLEIEAVIVDGLFAMGGGFKVLHKLALM
jgi:hypothetical protein